MKISKGGQRSLDDAMKTLYRETGARATGYTGDELRTALTRGGAAGMDARLDAMVRIPGPLDVAAALARAGLEVVPDPATPAAPFTGWRTSSKGKDFPVLDWVEPDSPAARAGLQDGDLVVALGERRLVAERLDKELGLLKPGQPVGISFFRDGTLRRLELTPGAPVPPKLIVRPRADAGPGQKALLDAWLGLPSSPAPAP